MSNCLFGSKAKSGSPSSFTLDTGGICFALGVDNVICPLLDKIPELVGVPWKKLLGAVAKQAFGLIVDLITDRIDTASFCSASPPPLPPDITFAEVFSFIASYVPPFSLIASSDSLMRKITAYYLYTKWFELCECRDRREEQPRRDDDDNGNVKLPRFQNNGQNCPPSEAIAAANSDLNRIDAFNQQTLASKQAFEDSFDNDYDTWKNVFIANIIINQGLDPNPEFVRTDENNPPPLSNESLTGGGGCMFVTYSGKISRIYDIWSEEVELFFPDGSSFDIRGFTMSRLAIGLFTIGGVNISSCNCPPPPPPPELPPPPSNCIPTPPPEFCAAFPDDPLCANVPPCPPDDCPPDGIEPTDITVAAIEDCEVIQKTVQWYLE